MNGGIDRHFPQRTAGPDPLCQTCLEDVWEKYALGMMSEEQSAPLEEHLLVCATCQDLLAKVDEYVDVAKTAMALKAAAAEDHPYVSDLRTRRRLSKPVKVAAALAGGLIFFR